MVIAWEQNYQIENCLYYIAVYLMLKKKKIRNELNKAENLINSFLKPEDNAKKYLYITNPDGTRFKIEYGAKFENYSIAPVRRR